MKETSYKVEGLKKGQIKDLIKLAKELGFKARFLPCMRYGCAHPTIGNFVVDWTSFEGGGLPEKLRAQKAIRKATRQAALDFYDYEELSQ